MEHLSLPALQPNLPKFATSWRKAGMCVIFSSTPMTNKNECEAVNILWSSSGFKDIIMFHNMSTKVFLFRFGPF